MKESMSIALLSAVVFLFGCSENIPSNIKPKQSVQKHNYAAARYQSPPKSPERKSPITFSGPTQQELEQYDKDPRSKREMDRIMQDPMAERYGRRDIP